MAEEGAIASVFAVLLCTHNGGNMLEAQLESISHQILLPDLVLIHDWGSTDGTPNQVLRWKKATANLFDVRFYRHEEAPGPARSFFQAISDTLDQGLKFDWLLLCDQDDIWREDKISEIAACGGRCSYLQLIHGDYILINECGDFVGGGLHGRRRFDESSMSALAVNVVPGMCMALRRDFLVKSRPLWGGGIWYMHDWAFCVCAYLLEAPVGYIDKPLVEYRQHKSNIQGVKLWWMPREIWRRVARAREFTRLTYLQLANLQDRWPAFVIPNRFEIATSVVRGALLPRLLALVVAIRVAIFWPGR